MADLQEQDRKLTAQWDGEKGEIDTIKELKQKIDEAQVQFENAQRKGELEKAAMNSGSM